MRSRKSFERQEGVKSGRLIVIAAEGRETENIYFEAMKAFMHASDIHIEVLRRETNNSSPEEVYRQIKGFVTEYDLDDDDQLWAVVDKDNWPERMLSEVATRCHQNRYFNFCVSNPCFELWLILHFEDVEQYTPEDLKSLSENRRNSGRGATWTKRRLRTLMDSYRESKYDAKSLLPYVEDAITRASSLDCSPHDRWPQTVGTRVYRLVKSILGI